MTIWVLTSEYNDYDQHGEYFIHAWDHKPSVEELIAQGVEKMRTHCEDFPAFVLAGGGRIEKGTYYEDQWFQWYLLQEIK